MNAGQVWVIAAAISLAAHAAFAAWVETRDPVAARPVHHVVEMQLQPRRSPPPPPKPKLITLPEPPPPPKPPVAHKVAPKPVPVPATPPPPQVQKVGIDETTAAKDGLAVQTGGTLEGEVGTGNTMDKTPPQIEAPVEPPAPKPTASRHFVPEFKVTRLPQPKSPIQPELPAAFREAQREAHLTVEVEIDETGRVVHAKVLGKDEFGLTAAVVAAVQRTEFEPALVGTQPVPVRYHIPFTFRVHG